MNFETSKTKEADEAAKTGKTSKSFKKNLIEQKSIFTYQRSIRWGTRRQRIMTVQGVDIHAIPLTRLDLTMNTRWNYFKRRLPFNRFKGYASSKSRREMPHELSDEAIFPSVAFSPVFQPGFSSFASDWFPMWCLPPPERREKTFSHTDSTIEVFEEVFWFEEVRNAPKCDCQLEKIV